MLFRSGVPKSFAKAVDWWERAAELSDIASQYNLGLAYYQGKGAEKDLNKARNWLDKAAAQGHADAKRVLGIIGEQELVTQSTPTTTSSASSGTRQTTSVSSGQTNNAALSSTSNRTIVNVNFRAAQVEFDNLALRAAPSSESPPIGALDQGTPVKIIQTNGGWARIEVPRPIKFWVFGSYVDGAPQGRINANSVRLRNSPTTGGNSSIVAQLNRGDPVTVHASSGDWKQVSAERAIVIWTQLSGLAEQNPVTQSWVDNFNALSGATPRSTTTTESSVASATVAYKAAWVNVDETPVLGRPEDGAALLNYIVRDTPVKALGSKGDWLMIQAPGGLDVWVYGKFVSESGSLAEINENRVRIRSLPSSAAESDILGLLDQGTRVEVISRKGDWIRVRVHQSVAGWIRKDAATAPGDLSAGWQERWDAIRSEAIN